MCLFFAYICIQQTVFNFDKQSKRQQRPLCRPVESRAFTVKEVLQGTHWMTDIKTALDQKSTLYIRIRQINVLFRMGNAKINILGNYTHKLAAIKK